MSKNKATPTAAERRHIARSGWYEERFQEMQGRQRFDCVHCARPMWFPASKFGKYITCGPECSAARRESLKAKRNCETCGEVFTPRPAQIRSGHGRFCSQACNTAARSALLAPDAQERSQATMRKLHAAGLVRMPKGEENPRWNGGKEAARARARVRVAEYKRQNPDRVRAHAHNRRQRIGHVTVAVIRELRAAQKGCCAICRKRDDARLTLDHIQPVSRGGTNDRHNLQLLCRSCNTKKAAKDPLEYMQSLGFLL